LPKMLFNAPSMLSPGPRIYAVLILLRSSTNLPSLSTRWISIDELEKVRFATAGCFRSVKSSSEAIEERSLGVRAQA
jgi:hypothetical protein